MSASNIPTSAPTLNLASGHLYRAIVTLPRHLCERDLPLQERIVFFEGPLCGKAQHLAQLLMQVWGTDTAGWCESGFIYNISSARELVAENLSDDLDARLLEIGRGGETRIHYAAPADVDLFVTPRVHARLLSALQTTATSRTDAVKGGGL